MYDPFDRHPKLVHLHLPEDEELWPRVRVHTKEGKQRWRKIRKVQDTDTLDFREGGALFTMYGKPGRKPKVELKPKDPEVAEILRRKSLHISRDPIVRLINKDPDDLGILHALMAALAEETASLRFDRSEAERKGANPDLSSSISVRRLKALKDISDTYLKRLDLQKNQVINMEGAAFKAVFALLVDAFIDSMTGLRVPTETQDAVLLGLSTTLSDPTWTANAKSKMKEVTS